MTGKLASLAAIFAQLSLLAVGGLNTTLPEMQRQVVQLHGWMTSRDFADLFALAQAAPGPNTLLATLIGLRVAGVPGALLATLSACAPSSLLTFVAFRAWTRFRHAPWRAVVQRGLVPVTAGLIMAAAVLLTEATSASLAKAAVAAVTALALVFRPVHPLWLLGAGAVLGALGLLD
jgi:chromate transporter